MGNKIGPYILVTSLVLVLIFIVGLRYGQSVEKSNKKVEFTLSLPPTKIPPTSIPLEFKTYVHKICGIQFLYPSSLNIQKESSSGATFGKDEAKSIEFSCEKKNPFDLNGDKIATEELKFQNQTLKAPTKKDGNRKLVFLTLRNPINAKSIYIWIETRLLPLFESSLKFQ